MRQLVVLVLMVVMVPLSSFAASGGSKKKLKLHGYYGYAMATPAEINTLQTAFTAPKPGDITSHFFYGGGLGLMLGQKFELVAEYESLTAKNLASSGNGFTIDVTAAWLDAHYYLTRNKVAFYMGAGVGLPLTQKVNRKVGASSLDYTGDKLLAYEGVLGADLALGSTVSIIFEASYRIMSAYELKTSTNSQLTNANGSKTKLELSGVRALAGLAFHF